MKGRDLKEGEFSFDLTQVTDETGETETENGAHRTAVNDPEGKVVFEDVLITEPGTYYYRITGTPSENENAAEAESFVAKVEVTAGGEYQDQLEAVVTYPEGQPEFAYTYAAVGEVTIDAIRTVLENGTLEEGMFRFELKDSEGNVLQTVANDGNGNVVFEPLKFTEENIGQKLEYTVSEVNDRADDITYDSAVYTVTIMVEDSEASDGTLRITKEAGDMIFTNIMAEPETETETETETEIMTETATETETEIMTETATETETEIVTEIATETQTEIVTETELQSVPESRAETEIQTEKQEEQNGQKGVMLPFLVIIIMIALLILIFASKKIKNQK